MPTKHARVRPSGLELTYECEGSLQLQEQAGIVQDSEEIAEGHAAHWVARRALAGHAHELPVGAKFHYNGREWTVDSDMYIGAQLYLKTLMKGREHLHIEEWVDIPRIHRTECAGTPDAWAFFSDAREAFDSCPVGVHPDLFNQGKIRLVRVPDYKYGHRFVEVYQNKQITAYSVGVMDALHLHDIDPNLWVDMVLVQPRSYHKEGPVRRWLIQAMELRALVNLIAGKVERALGPKPPTKTGNHCLDCTARHICTTLQYAVQSIAQFAGTAERVELDSHAVGVELAMVDDALKLLEARRTGLAAQADAMGRQGKPIPNYHYEPGRTNLTYFDDVNADELIAFGDLCNINLRRKLERKDLLVTPTQAINLGIDPKCMESYASRPKGALKLTRDDSTTAQKVFNR